MNQRMQGEWGVEPRTEDLAALAERGRQLHSQAVFEACARLLWPFKGTAAGKAERFAAGEFKLTSK